MMLSLLRLREYVGECGVPKKHVACHLGVPTLCG
jgi:hypothetical protein